MASDGTSYGYLPTAQQVKLFGAYAQSNSIIMVYFRTYRCGLKPL